MKTMKTLSPEATQIAVNTDAESPARAATSSGHFIVMRSAVLSMHETQESANRQAKLLAAEHGGKFVVFQAIRAYERPATPAAVEVAI